MIKQFRIPLSDLLDFKSLTRLTGIYQNDKIYNTYKQ